jgi:AraC-like DNA-binding protein
MRSINFAIVPPPNILRQDVECFMVAEYAGEEGVAIKVSPSGVPGIVFQHDQGRSAIENIITQSGRKVTTPTLFLYGPGTEPSVMNYKKGSYTTTQVILKPHALSTLLGMNASVLTNGSVELDEFSAGDLNDQLIEARNGQECIALLTGFLVARFRQAKARDTLVEESLRLIHQDIAFIDVRYLRQRLNLSERQFERRFSQTVGLSPGAYIRVKRFNEAIRLMKTGQYARLTDVAHALNFHDQSHFIRDVKEFSGMTPKSLSQQEDDFHHGQTGYSYI